MRYKIHITMIICIFTIFISSAAIAVIKNVSVGRGLMVKALPEETNFNLILSLEKEKINLKKATIIEFKIENISETEQKIDFWNIVVRAEKEGEALPPSFSFKDKLNCKIVLPKGTFTSMKIPLSNIYKIDSPGEYILRAHYELPDSNKVINSNDLKIIVEP